MTLGPDAQQLLQAMTGPAPDDPRFTGEPPDLSRVGDEELGALFVAAWQVAPETTQGATQGATQETAPAAVTAAGAVRLAVQERSPAFTPTACTDLFHTIAERGFSPGVAVAAVLRCTGPLPPDLAAPAAVLARDARGLGRLVLAALAGPAVHAAVSAGVRADLAGDPLAAAEVEEVLALDVAGRAVVAEADRHRDMGGVAALPDIIDRLAGLPGYGPFARTALETAGARIVDIHSGRTAYAADKAFTPLEVDVLWRACQVALLRDEPWVGEVLQRLLPGAVVAPTSARTAPSQAAGHALAQAVAAWPTPESVAALRAARTAARHAGLVKKLDRLVPVAEQGLARRPAIALRLPAGAAPTRAQLTTMTHALEGGYLGDVSFPWERWHADVPGDLAARLIWEAETAPGRWEAALGAPPRGGRVRLWHPARAGAADRAAWRDTVVERRLTQPVRQAFREHYPASDGTETDMFGGYAVAIRPLLGVAVRDGWRGEHGAGLLRRDLGRWRVAFAVDGPLHRGASGFGFTGALHLQHRDGSQWCPARFTDAPPVLVSEALRSVDLLVSVAAFGLDDDPRLRDDARWQALTRLADRPLGEPDRMRRAALRRILAGVDGVSFGDRHVHVGPYAVHLATARVTRDGDPVATDVRHRVPASAVPWLPYDEHLLERVAHTVVALAH
ncbi:DUF4132 domain-containing protein [Dactylosporangium sp. NPDC006015]|uniref:DUF4132 domain-containing protein n=1 Tax=Dactylosporangium sp. NPDC006015 TaxID=3154576 RepID=UPI0033A77877